MRVTVAQILSSQGIPAQPDNILITSGSQQALNLVAQVLLHPRDVVLVESPTYNVAIDLFRSLDVRLLGVPVDEGGMQVERVEDALRTARPRLIFTVPTFHNPTGTCMSSQRRRRLVALAERYNVPILEDDFIGNLRFEGRALPAIKALDSGGHVIYAGTFSKIMMPGLRLGFLVAIGPIYERLLASKYVSDLATSELLQRALEEYITVGRYHAHLRRVVQAHRARRDAMVQALRRYLPAEARWLPPQGGRYVWLQLPE
ncbi:MAG: PLP-dependent aminotransferase family protein, partial [Delftia sp.]|nr:PLP-dependent aminotransferase family protein [Delftia sp.]